MNTRNCWSRPHEEKGYSILVAKFIFQYLITKVFPS